MKKTIILFGIILMGIINLNAQDCYTVKEINNKTENPDLSSKRFTFGIKQMTEELLGEKFTICLDGKPVVVNITSIEAPTVGINFGPFMIRKKNTIVKTEVIINGKVYVGEGTAKLSVKASFAELKDENLPFEKSVFAQYPEVEKLKQSLYEKGAVYAAMSGSGSAVFGLFKELPLLSFENYSISHS